MLGEQSFRDPFPGAGSGREAAASRRSPASPKDFGDFRVESGIREVPARSKFGRFRPDLAPRPL